MKISEKFAKFPPRREDSVCLQEVVSNGNGFHTPMFDYPVAFASVFNITHYFCRSVYYLGLEDELSLTCLKSLLEYRPNSPRTLIMLALLYIKLGDGNKATFCAKLAIQVVTRIGLGDDLQVVATKHYDYLPFSDEMIYSDWKTSENFLERSYYILMWALNEKRGLSEIVCIGMSRIFAQKDYLDPVSIPLVLRAAQSLLQLDVIQKLARVGEIAFQACIEDEAIFVHPADILSLPFISSKTAKLVTEVASFRNTFPDVCKNHDMKPIWNASSGEGYLHRLFEWARLEIGLSSKMVIPELIKEFFTEFSYSSSLWNTKMRLLFHRRHVILSTTPLMISSTMCKPSYPLHDDNWNTMPSSGINQAPKSTRILRLGYLSADFRKHPVGRLVQNVFKLHDRSRFHVVCFATIVSQVRHQNLSILNGEDSEAWIRKSRNVDSIAANIVSNCDEYVELFTRAIVSSTNVPNGQNLIIRLTSMTDAQIADSISQSRVDILVDLHGWSDGRRITLLCIHPAPILITWLGYPGSVGKYVDYIIADPVIAPLPKAIVSTGIGKNATGSDLIENVFSEKLIILPRVYMPVDTHLADEDFSSDDILKINSFDYHQNFTLLAEVRKSFGLPVVGKLLVALHQVSKWWSSIDSWLDILSSNPNSYLILPFPGQVTYTRFGNFSSVLAVSLFDIHRPEINSSCEDFVKSKFGTFAELEFFDENAEKERLKYSEFNRVLENLFKILENHSVKPERIFFIPRIMSRREHLSRLASMDILLDASYVTGMSTVVDALWIGLPVMTLLYESLPNQYMARRERSDVSMSARTSSSLILASDCGSVNSIEFLVDMQGSSVQHNRNKALNLIELLKQENYTLDVFSSTNKSVIFESAYQQKWHDKITSLISENEMIAISKAEYLIKIKQLMTNSNLSMNLRKCLINSRNSSALFDLPKFVKGLEAGILLAWTRFSQDLDADHIVVVPT